MAITTVGGSGTTSSSLASGAGVDLALFTTPNTANMLFNITIITAGGAAVGTADTAAQAAVAPATKDGTSMGTNNGYQNGPWAQGGHPGNPGRVGKDGSEENIFVSRQTVGPNTSVHVPIFNSDESTRTIYVCWNYCGIAF